MKKSSLCLVMRLLQTSLLKEKQQEKEKNEAIAEAEFVEGLEAA